MVSNETISLRCALLSLRLCGKNTSLLTAADAESARDNAENSSIEKFHLSPREVYRVDFFNRANSSRSFATSSSAFLRAAASSAGVNKNSPVCESRKRKPSPVSTKSKPKTSLFSVPFLPFISTYFHSSNENR
jgi:hypothetical protein